MKVPTSCSDNHCSNTCTKKFVVNKLTGSMEHVPRCSCPVGYSWKNERAQYECQIPTNFIPMEVRSYNNEPSNFSLKKRSKGAKAKDKSKERTEFFGGFYDAASNEGEGGIDLISLF